MYIGQRRHVRSTRQRHHHMMAADGRSTVVLWTRGCGPTTLQYPSRSPGSNLARLELDFPEDSGSLGGREAGGGFPHWRLRHFVGGKWSICPCKAIEKRAGSKFARPRHDLRDHPNPRSPKVVAVRYSMTHSLLHSCTYIHRLCHGLASASEWRMAAAWTATTRHAPVTAAPDLACPSRHGDIDASPGQR